MGSRKPVAVIVTAAMLLVGLTTLPIAAAQTPPDPPPEVPLDPTQAQPTQEVEWARTEDSKTFVTDQPGVYRTETYTEPVNYRDPVTGQMTPIDTTLSRDSDRDGKKETAATPDPVEVASSTADPTLATVKTRNGASVSFKMTDTATVPAQVDGDTATFADAKPGVDVKITAQPNGVKEHIVLENASSPRVHTFELNAPGLTPVVTDTGSVELRNPDGSVAAVIPHGWMEDATPHLAERAAKASDKVVYSITVENNKTYLTVTPDDTWLDDPARVWPVTIDPTVNIVTDAPDDTFVMALTGMDRSTLDNIQTGNGYFPERAYLQFPSFSTLNGKRIAYSELQLFQHGTATTNCAPQPTDLYRITSAWNNAPTWNGAQVQNFSLIPKTAAGAVASFDSAYGAPGCPANLVRVNVTPTAQGWAAGTYPNLGFELRARNESTYAQWKAFHSAQGLFPPKLVTVWSLPPSANDPNPPTGIQPTGAASSAAPTLAATYTDPQNDPGRTQLAVVDAATNLSVVGPTGVAAGGDGTTVASGQTSTFAVPTGILRTDRTYKVLAVNIDNGGNDSAVVTTTNPFTVPAVAVKENLANSSLFGPDQKVPVIVAADKNPTGIELLVDGNVVATDTTAPFEPVFDTTTIPDGNHTLTVRTLGVTPQITSAPVNVKIMNSTTADTFTKLRADRELGLITPDEWATTTLSIAVQATDVPVRYRSEEIGEASLAIAEITMWWNFLSASAKQSLNSMLPTRTSVPPNAGASLTAVEALATPPPSTLCPEIIRRDTGLISWVDLCQATYPSPIPGMEPLKVAYSWEQEGVKKIPWVDNIGVVNNETVPMSPNGVPDQVDQAAVKVWKALQFYQGQGWEIRAPEIRVTIWNSSFSSGEISASVVPCGVTSNQFDQFIWQNTNCLDMHLPLPRPSDGTSKTPELHYGFDLSTSGNAAAELLVAHEAFHVVQYKYLPNVFQAAVYDHSPFRLRDRVSQTWWLMESTARLMEKNYTVSKPLHPYLQPVPDVDLVYESPERPLFDAALSPASLSFFPGFDLDEEKYKQYRTYDLWVLWSWLEKHIDPGIVLQVWNDVQGAVPPKESIVSRLGGDAGAAEILSHWWNYMWRVDNNGLGLDPIQRLQFLNNAGEALERKNRPLPRYTPTTFLLNPRLDYVEGSPITPTSSPQTATTGPIGAFGAASIEVLPPPQVQNQVWNLMLDVQPNAGNPSHASVDVIAFNGQEMQSFSYQRPECVTKTHLPNGVTSFLVTLNALCDRAALLFTAGPEQVGFSVSYRYFGTGTGGGAIIKHTRGPLPDKYPEYDFISGVNAYGTLGGDRVCVLNGDEQVLCHNTLPGILPSFPDRVTDPRPEESHPMWDLMTYPGWSNAPYDQWGIAKTVGSNTQVETTAPPSDAFNPHVQVDEFSTDAPMEFPDSQGNYASSTVSPIEDQGWQVTHEYFGNADDIAIHPDLNLGGSLTADVIGARVTVKNTGTSEASFKYRRVLDIDAPIGEHDGSMLTKDVLSGGNTDQNYMRVRPTFGYANPDPTVPLPDLCMISPIEPAGPTECSPTNLFEEQMVHAGDVGYEFDVGVSIDVDLGSIGPGFSRTFWVFFGAVRPSTPSPAWHVPTTQSWLMFQSWCCGGSPPGREVGSALQFTSFAAKGYVGVAPVAHQ